MLRPLALLLALAAAGPAHAFCGFFVAKGDAGLFNEASKVVMVRDGDRTVITMVNDFRGDVADFAMVIPAPTVLRREQIQVTDPAIVEHLDAYTAPRLVEYHDDDPCRTVMFEMRTDCPTCAMVAPSAAPPGRDSALGVTVEAEYQVGEYDIQILSATQSDGLATWLTENGYRIPEGAGPILGSYIRQDMTFFVAKVNLEAHAAGGAGFLRPLRIAFESEKFMLPIRLGTVNARGKQDLILWTLTRRGRVETVNYRTERMPTGAEIPTYVEKEFGRVYKAIFDEAIEGRGGAGVMLEYAWDMGWCDPCAADPLSVAELRELGVFWVEDREPAGRGPQAVDVYVTRLHARYDAESFPEDLRLMQTGDRSNFQGRYVMRHPWRGEPACEAAEQYLARLPSRFEDEADTLAALTGWELEEIRAAMAKAGTPPGGPGDRLWWEGLWPR